MKDVISLADQITVDSNRKSIIKTITNSTEFNEAFELLEVTMNNAYT